MRHPTTTDQAVAAEVAWAGAAAVPAAGAAAARGMPWARASTPVTRPTPAFLSTQLIAPPLSPRRTFLRTPPRLSAHGQHSHRSPPPQPPPRYPSLIPSQPWRPLARPTLVQHLLCLAPPHRPLAPRTHPVPALAHQSPPSPLDLPSPPPPLQQTQPRGLSPHHPPPLASRPALADLFPPRPPPRPLPPPPPQQTRSAPTAAPSAAA
mmetsp:Transcript_23145/g.72602  ORF Transcript_23145/g.72602 Transcript_23145/m.72602 type:complete len:207 (-) Transcript_23145:50-670(-)